MSQYTTVAVRVGMRTVLDSGFCTHLRNTCSAYTIHTFITEGLDMPQSSDPTPVLVQYTAETMCDNISVNSTERNVAFKLNYVNV
jgi:hypothetical protein